MRRPQTWTAFKDSGYFKHAKVPSIVKLDGHLWQLDSAWNKKANATKRATSLRTRSRSAARLSKMKGRPPSYLVYKSRKK